MKYGIKPNQSIILNGPKVTNKNIRAIIIDNNEKKIYEFSIENSLTKIKKLLNFYSFKEIQFKKDELDVLFLGVDEDLKKNKNFFKIKSIDDCFFGNGILVKLPANGDYEKLQSTKITVEDLEKVVEFC